MTEHTVTLSPQLRQMGKDALLLLAILGVAFTVITRAGYVMTKEAHAQDVFMVSQAVTRLDSISKTDRRYSEETRLLVRFVSCTVSYGHEKCANAYGGVIDVEGLLSPR